ncbi:hypothetical protein E2C01_071593 [Portunus trituberculatus]|uniref:Uncharacterized protein n=1 Tax=Portunus trituberculatus TaxID=210409 RepID=A0A5B7I5B8_PORTR|nr:hypothetical protein [Portunus trituberculatus]
MAGDRQGRSGKVQ